MKKLKATIIGVGMVLSVLVSAPLHAEEKPSLKQTMDWLSDYLPREGHCTNIASYKTIKTELLYDSKRQTIHITEYINALKLADGRYFLTKDLPLYTLKKLKTVYLGGCWALQWQSKENDIRVQAWYKQGKDGATPMIEDGVNLVWFKDEASVIRAAKAFRHAASLAEEPPRTELF